jgi:hypothetical protein
MAALPPLEKVCGIASLSPAGTCLEAATAPICHHVRCNVANFDTISWANEADLDPEILYPNSLVLKN